MTARRRKRRTRGAALVEATLVLPMLVLLMMNTLNFGMYIYAWVTVNNTARALLLYRVYSGVVVGFPPIPSVTQMQSVVTTETSTLPNHGSITWGICDNANGTITTEGPAAPASCLADPTAPTQYTSYTAQVTYTFLPLAAGLTPRLGGTITRQVSMRSME